MSEERRSNWMTKYGVPSLALSVAVFVLQQQQQTFDRLQHTIEGGWQFYSGARTPLQYADDADRELSLLKVVGNAFPNIYCDVRQDIYERAWAARPADLTISAGSASSALGLNGISVRAAEDGRALIESSDLENLRQELVARSSPMRAKYAENVVQAWMPKMPWTAGNGGQCPDLNGGATIRQTPASQIARDFEAVSPPPRASSEVELRVEEAPASASAGPGALARSSAAGSDVVLAAPPSTGSPPDMETMPTLMRVFFRIRTDSPREGGVAANARTELSPYNYRVMRGVERVAPDRFPEGAEVRYFGPDEARAAEQLAVYLNYQFRSENLTFHPKAVGAAFPNMPRQNLEVWIPNP